EMLPDDWDVLSDLSIHLIFAHRDGVAIFDGLMRRHPQAAAPYYFRGDAYGLQEKLEPAIADLSTYIRLSPEDPRGYSLRGTYLEEAGDYGRASTDFGETIKLQTDPKLLSAAYENRCVSRAEARDQLAAGIEDCNRALNMNDGWWEAYTGRAFAEFRQKKY